MNRRVLLSLLAAGGATALLALLPFKSLVGLPRFITRKGRWRFFPRPRTVLYLHRKSGLIRYDRLEHKDPTVSQVSLKNYEAVTLQDVVKRLGEQRAALESDNGVSGPILQLVRGHRILEVMTLERVLEGKFDEARKFLWFYLTDERAQPAFGWLWSNLRLHDLLAGLTVRFGTQQDYSAFIDLITHRESLGEDRDWQNRLGKWKDQNSKWFKRWRNRQKRVSWAGILM